MVRGDLRVGVAGLMLLAIAACGGDDDETVTTLGLEGEPRAGVASTIDWQVRLDHEAEIVTVADETLILKTPVSDRVWGLQSWRGGQTFEIDPSETPWDRGPLLTVAGGRILISERRSSDPGDRWIVAFDVATGGQLWAVRHGIDDARPVVVGDQVIVATRDDATAGIVGAVRAIALADGTQRWSLPLDLAPDEKPATGDFDDTAPVLATDGDTLAVRTAPSAVSIIDVGTGREVGVFEGDGEITAARPIDGGGIVVVSESVDPITARLHGIESASGTTRWTVDAADDSFWSSGSTIVISGIEHDYEALDIGSGELLWTAAGRYGQVIAESEGVLITDRVAGFRADDGELAWSTFDAFTQNVWFSPGVVVVDGTEEVTALDLVTGEERWVREGANALIATEREVLLTDGDRYVLVDGASGAELWTLAEPDRGKATAFAGADGMLFLCVTADGDSWVLALAPPD